MNGPAPSAAETQCSPTSRANGAGRIGAARLSPANGYAHDVSALVVESLSLAPLNKDADDSMSDKPETTSKAQSAVQGWADWSKKTGVALPSDQIVADVVEAYAADLVPHGRWFPISSLPEGRHVLLYWQDGERGAGGTECATVFRGPGGEWSYWTHGGPNSGSDWEPYNREKPTHWMPLPEPPEDQDV